MTLPVTITSVQQILDTQPLIASASAVTSAAIYSALGQEEAKIWTKLAVRYALPLSPIPPMVTVLAIDLTVNNLLVKQAILTNTLDKSPWPAYYSSAQAYLDMLSNGDIDLLNQSLQAIAATQLTMYFSGTGYAPTFSEVPSEYIFPDPNKQADDINDRDSRGGIVFP